MNLIPQQSAHFYEHFNGVFKACHQVPKKDGSGMKNTTITDARRMHLFPSASNVTGVVAEPGLNNWKLTQAILSAITLPRKREPYTAYIERGLAGLGATASDARAVLGWCHDNPPRHIQTDDYFAEQVVQDMEAQSEKAKELGTEIHYVLSEFVGLKVHRPPISAESFELAEPAKEWLAKNVVKVHGVEKIVGAPEHGYAGTLDLDCELKDIGPAVIDWKTATVKRNGKGARPVFRNSWGKQLAAYAMAGEEPRTRALVSVIIDKGNAGEVFAMRWDNPGELWQQFLHSAAIWRFENDYDPRQQL